MQSYALDSLGKKYFIKEAERSKDYFCIECGGRLRVRGGSQYLRAHFFHIQDIVSCRQAGKTKEHVAIQALIQEQIGRTSCEEEVRFSEIGRIADVAWPDKKLVFEVQCSPISAKEVEGRNRDYASIGWNVVWILYDKTFNGEYLTQAESYLQSKTHYFSDGKSLYDQCSVVHNNRRYGFTDRRRVYVDTIESASFSPILQLPKAIQERLTSWKYCLQGDYLWSSFHAQDDGWQEAIEKLALFERRLKPARNYLNPLRRLLSGVRALWYVILERSCR